MSIIRRLRITTPFLMKATLIVFFLSSLSTGLIGVKSSVLSQPRNTSEQNNSDSDHRDLQIFGNWGNNKPPDPFTSFNEFLRLVKFYVPDQFIEDLPSNFPESSELELRNFWCSEIEVGSIEDRITEVSYRKTKYSVKIENLEVFCRLDWTYHKGQNTNPDDGGARFNIRKSSIEVSYVIVSDTFPRNANEGESSQGKNSDYSGLYPWLTKPKECWSDIKVKDMKFWGGARAFIMNLIELVLKNRLNKILEEELCVHLQEGVVDGLNMAFAKILEELMPFIKGEITLNNVDPLVSQQKLQLPNNAEVMNFEDDMLFRTFQKLTSDTLNAQVESGPDGETDKGINVMLRENVLDQNGVFSISLDSRNRNLQSQVADDDDSVGYSHQMDGHNANVNARLSFVNLFGLDSFSMILPFVVLGPQTLTSQLFLDQVEVELGIALDFISLEPMSTDEFHVQLPDHTEYFKVGFALQSISSALSYLLAMDFSLIRENLKLFNLLNSDHYARCFVSITHKIELSRIEVFVEKLFTPAVFSLFSEGFDGVVNTLLGVIFNLYADAVEKVAPTYLGTTARELLNNATQNIWGDSSYKCPIYELSLSSSTEDKYIDFRDLFLDEYAAGAYGGKGTLPYGDLSYKLFGQLRKTLMGPGENELPMINDSITKMTQSKSGIPGILFLTEQGSIRKLFDLSLPYIGVMFNATMSHASVQNLNSIDYPIQLLQPIPQNPHMLSNRIRMSTDKTSPLRFSSQLQFSFFSNEDNKTRKNVVAVELGIYNAIIVASLLAKVETERFMTFSPLDLYDVNCWLSTIDSPILDEVGMPEVTDGGFGTDPTVAIVDLGLTAEDFNLQIECLSCESPGMKELPNILWILDWIGTLDHVSDSLIDLTMSAARGERTYIQLSRILFHAKKACPSHPYYDKNFVPDDYIDVWDLGMDRETAESFVMIGSIMTQVISIVTILSFTTDQQTNSDRLSAQKMFDWSMTDNNNIPTKLLDFGNLDSPVGDIVKQILDIIQSKFVSFAEDQHNPKGYDIGINVFFRSSLLDQDGSYTFPVQQNLTSHLELSSIRLNGLDTFTFFDPFHPIASQTLRTQMSLERLTVDLNFALNTTSLSSVLGLQNQQRNPNSKFEEHYFSIVFNLEDISFDASLLLALDEGILGGLPMVSLMNTKKAVDCLLSGVYEMDLAQLLFTAGKIGNMEVKGFVSKDIKSAVVESSEALFDMYKEQIESALPIMFDSVIRKALNNRIHDYLQNYNNCPTYQFSDNGQKYVDFRDLFLSSDDAASVGASGTMPYGDLLIKLTNFIDTELVAPDDDGLPKINTNYIRPITESNSMIPGSYYLSSMGGGCAGSNGLLDIGQMYFGLCNMRLENLDTVGYPLQILDPSLEHRHVLHNKATIGKENDPLKLIAQSLLSIDYYGLQVYNEVLFSIDLVGMSFVNTIVAKLDAMKFLSFPLRDIKNVYCWLSLIPDLASDMGAFILDADFTSDSATLDVICGSCTSRRVEEIPDVLTILKSEGLLDELFKRMRLLVESVIDTSNEDSVIAQLLRDSGKYCPHDSRYVPSSASAADSKKLDLTNFMYQQLETLIFAGSILSQIFMVTVALSLPSNSDITNSPLSAQRALVLPPNVQLVDFTNRNTSMDDFVYKAFEKINENLGGMKDDSSHEDGSDLGVNVHLRSKLLDADGSYTIDMNTELIPGVQLETVRLKGLDSFSLANILRPIAAQTLQSQIVLDEISVEVTIAFDTSLMMRFAGSEPHFYARKNIEHMTISFNFHDVFIMSALLLGLDEGKLGNIPLGIILELDSIFDCILASIYKFDVTQLIISIGRIEAMKVEGFISDEIGAFISNSSSVLLQQYITDVTSGISLLSDSVVRELVNNKTHAYLQSSIDCPYNQFSNVDQKYVDFRDLFLSSDDAASVGASGTMPYGDLLIKLTNYINTELVAPDDDGSPKINTNYIRPITESNSMIPGSYYLSSMGGGCAGSNGLLDIGQMYFGLCNMRLENLDTVGYPLQILDPSLEHRHVLHNKATIGKENDPLKLIAQSLLSIDYYGLQIYNDFLLSIDLVGMSFVNTIVAKLDAMKFLSFPLRDIKNVYCWLSLIPDLASDMGAFILDADFTSDSATLDVICGSCTSRRVEEIPDVLTILKSEGLLDELFKRMRLLVESVIDTSNEDSVIAQLLRDSGKYCPHDSRYVPSSASAADSKKLDLTNFMYQQLETLIFAGSILSQIFMVTVALSLPSNSDITNSPLSAQRALVLPPNVQLVDFTNRNTSMDDFVYKAFEKINENLGGMKDDSSHEDGSDLGVNVHLRSKLLDADGSYTIDMNTELIPGVQLETVRLKGLDSFSLINILKPIAAQTLQSQIVLDEISVEVTIAFDTSSINVLRNSNDVAVEVLRKLVRNDNIEQTVVSFSLSDLSASFALFLAIDDDKLREFHLEMLLHTDQALDCILSTIFDVDVTQLIISIGRIEAMKVEGFISEEIEDMISRFSKRILNEYGNDIVSGIPFIVDSILREYINDKLETRMLDVEGCFVEDVINTTAFIDLRDLLLNADDAASVGASGTMPYGDLFMNIMKTVNTELTSLDDTGMPKINENVIRPATKFISDVEGTIFYEGEILNQQLYLNETQSSSDDVVRLQMYDLRIENLDTVRSPMDIFEARDDPYVLDNRLLMGLSSKPVRISSRFAFAMIGDNTNLDNDFTITLIFHNAYVLISFLIKVNEYYLMNIPSNEITNPNCWIASIPGPKLNEFGLRERSEKDYNAKLLDIDISAEDVFLEIDCHKCSSPDIEALGIHLKSSEGRNNSTIMGKAVLERATEILSGGVSQVAIDRMLSTAMANCEYLRGSETITTEFSQMIAPKVDSDAIEVTLLVGLVFGSFFAYIMFTYVVTRRSQRKNYEIWLRTLSDNEVRKMYKRQLERDAEKKSQEYLTQSIIFSNAISLKSRLLIPLAILVSIAFFVSGHLSLGATVKVDMIIAGQEVILQNFFDFAILDTIQTMWRKGMRIIGGTLFFASVGWPYVKQSILLILWVTPPWMISTKLRGYFFLQLDALGKWSITDIYVLMITLIVFRISVKSPELGILTEDFYSMEFLLIPMWGLYSNMIAQILSQINSHFIIHYHRVVVNDGFKRYNIKRGIKDELHSDTDTASLNKSPKSKSLKLSALCSHRFSLNSRETGKTARVEKRWNIFVLIVGILAIFLLLIGVVIPSFTIQIMGLASVLVEMGRTEEDPEALVQHHSIISMLIVVMGEAGYLHSFGHYLGFGILCALLICTSIFIPTILTISLLILWFFPMTERVRDIVLWSIESLTSWQYIEVYILACFLGLWQIGEVADILVGSFCEPLEGVFGSMAYFGLISDINARCFYSHAGLQAGTYVLILASFLLSGLSYIVMSAEKQQRREIDDRRREQRERLLKEKSLIDETFEESFDEIEDKKGLMDTDKSVDLRSEKTEKVGNFKNNDMGKIMMRKEKRIRSETNGKQKNTKGEKNRDKRKKIDSNENSKTKSNEKETGTPSLDTPTTDEKGENLLIDLGSFSNGDMGDEEKQDVQFDDEVSDSSAEASSQSSSYFSDESFESRGLDSEFIYDADMPIDVMISKIRPAPVQFTDLFWWLLVKSSSKENMHLERSSSVHYSSESSYESSYSGSYSDSDDYYSDDDDDYTDDANLDKVPKVCTSIPF